MTLIGIDIQSDALYVVRLQKKRKQYALLSADTILLSQSNGANGQIKQWDDVTGALKTFVTMHHLQGMNAALSVPSHLSILQRMSVPNGLTDEEIIAEINRYLKQQQGLHDKGDALLIDFVQLATDDLNATVLIEYAAIRELHLTPYRQCIAACGLRLKIVDVDLYALKQVMIYLLQKERPQTVYAVLHIHHDVANFITFNHRHELLHHLTWNCANSATQDVCTPMQHLIQQLSYKDKITQLCICAAKQTVQLIEKAPLPFAVCDLMSLNDSLMSVLQDERDNPKQPLFQNINNLLFALGMAMHEEPKW